MRKSQELMIKQTKLSKKDKKQFNDIKIRIDSSVGSIKKQAENIIKDLYIIANKKLFYFDHCSSMRVFIEKNKYTEKLSLDYATITTKLSIENHIEKNKLSDEVRHVGYAKLYEITKADIKEEKQIIELGKYSVVEVKNRIHRKHPITGTFVRQNFRKRKCVSIVRKNFEVPFHNRSRFLKSLLLLCEQWEVKQI